ncbi:MAG TPA: TonB-dependent receptor, partial [Polyangium sp.]|nr:TonB-dependent receptor [Polyangium sp.]
MKLLCWPKCPAIVAGALFLAPISFASSLSWAQPAAPEPPPAPAPAPVLVPPQIQGTPEAAYPAGGQGDAEVILVITVQKDGSVGQVEVAQGKEPFATAAKEAATKFRFTPGTRNGDPVAAKIRFAVSFHQTRVETPAAEEPPAPATNPETTSDKSPKAPVKKPKVEALTVDVRGEKLAPSVSTLSRAEVRQIPGTFGDPFRALEVLPGVSPIISGLPYFYVRGAPPGNVGYYLDGIRVPYLFHVGVGPSVVNPAMVERVNLHSGGYPSAFGRYAGAIVTADTTSPRVDFHGEGTIRLFDAGGMMETGFAGGRGTAMIGGRYSYTAALLSLLSPNVGLVYRDYQARVTYDLTPRDRISLVAFGAYDLLTDNTNNIETIVFGSEFYRIDARYERQLSNNGVLKWGTTLGYDQSRLGEQRNAQDKLLATRVFLVQPLHPKLTLRAGLDAQFDHYTADKRRWADPEDPDTIAYDNLFPPRDDTALGAYADLEWQIDPRVKVTPGVRFDVFRSAGASATSVSPRLQVTSQVHKRIRILHAFGLATQPPSFIIPLPGLSIGKLQGGLQTSVQASAGVEVEFPLGITATVTGFDNVFL